MNDERPLSLPADEQDTPLDLAPEGSQPVSRYLVGLLLLGSDQLAQGLGVPSSRRLMCLPEKRPRATCSVIWPLVR